MQNTIKKYIAPSKYERILIKKINLIGWLIFWNELLSPKFCRLRIISFWSMYNWLSIHVTLLLYPNSHVLTRTFCMIWIIQHTCVIMWFYVTIVNKRKETRVDIYFVIYCELSDPWRYFTAMNYITNQRKHIIYKQ